MAAPFPAPHVFVLSETAQALAKAVADVIVLAGPGGTISQDAQMLVDILRAISEGKSVMAFAASDATRELTVCQAGMFSGMSETLLMELLLAGALPSRAEGTERWIELGHLLEYMQRTKLAHALQEQIAAECQAMKLYDNESPE